MESQFELPVIVPYRPSRRIALLLVVMQAGAALAVSRSAVPEWLSWALIIALVGGAGASLWRLRSRSGQPPVQLLLSATDQWLLKTVDGAVRELRPLPPDFVHPQLVIMRFAAPDGGMHTFLLTPDNCDADPLRRIRVRLAFPINRPRGNGTAAAS